MDVVVLSSTRWASARLSKQHLAAAWTASGRDVLYVEPPVSPLSPLRQPDRWRDLVSRRVRRSEGTWVWTPLAAPAQNRRIPQRWNARRVSRSIARLAPSPTFTVAFGLESRGVLGRSPGVRIYHCTDSWADHPAADPATATRWEDEMTTAADVVTACSRPLVDVLAGRGVEARYVPHGVDHSWLLPAAPDPELDALPRPLVGYAGGMNFRIDPRLVEAAVGALDGGTLVLIGKAWRSARGGADEGLGRLSENDGVVRTGHLSGDALRSAVSALDVGLVPYRTTPFNRRSFPLKIPQYLAAGVDVVSTPNGATDEYPDEVHVAEEPSDFAEAVRAALSRRPGKERTAPAAVAARTWSAVADEFVGLVAAAGHHPEPDAG